MGGLCAGEKDGHVVKMQSGKLVRLRDTIAEGGFSTVHKVTDTENNTYAIKQIICQEDSMAVAARAEIEVHNAVSHSNVIQLLDWGEMANTVHPSAVDVWLLLPLHTRGTIFDVLLSKKPYPEVEALTLMEAICSAVSAIHEAGYTHRDIKALNVLLGSSLSDPLLMDLGSCRPLVVEITSRREAMLEQDIAETNSTASYRASELFDVPSEITIDGKVDVWSLGCLLYALICGHTPFESEKEGFMKLLAISGDVRFSDGVECSPETRAMITSAVMREPAERFMLTTLTEAITTQRSLLTRDHRYAQ